ncbi:MAG: HAMP domain-containing protein [Rhodospirillaceae bacterium]|nr:HAMP domain-containing protein [Rhodospirillaceae bacterium]MBT4425785.1 HAMP domain-containing protein [Rhodospirillaceae bacterium]MBT5674047.1 HAMP domain-containing protein [Rhodospirillaceae bacterium]MBT7294425.1 HAMP domain-containing protein [Rhodospirillaceae bacterium]
MAATRTSLLKHLTPKRLFWRSLLILLIPMVLLQGVVAYVFFERHWDTVSRRLALGLTGDIIYVMRTMQKYPEDEFREWTLRAAHREMQINAVFEKGAQLPAEAPPLGSSNMDRMLHHALSERLIIPFHIDTRRDDKNISVRIELKEGVLDILTPRKRMFSTTVYIFVLWMVGTALVVTAIAIFFLRNQIQPIRRLARAAEAFGKGREEVDFKPGGASEIRQAAAAFIDMRGRIARHIDQRTEMLAGVSHDLRTPLTRIKLQLTMLRESSPDTGAEISDLESDIAEMEKMIDEYLAFARGQGGEAPVPADLSALLSDIVEGARRNDTVLELDAEAALNLPLQPNAIKRCLTNLIDNAVRYGEQVEIRARRVGESVEVLVEDDGPGIPPESIEDVFKPFYRLDNSRNPNYAGAGLGLAIARDVARSHGGDIMLQKSALGGLRAVLRLPV